jgi:HTH-type transcriptional regulator, sugar sensing transcriptional regulator
VKKRLSDDSLEQNSTKFPSFMKTHDSKALTRRYVRTDRYLREHMNILEKTLARYGFSVNEVKTYLYLAGVTEKGATEISEAVSLHRTETYRVLRDLEKRGLILSVLGKPIKFAAVPPYRAVHQLLETQKIKIKLLEEEKADFLALWSSIPKGGIDCLGSKEVMQALEGRPQIISKAKELLEKSNRKIQIFAPDDYLTLLYQGDFIDRLKACSYDLEINLALEDSLKSRIFCEQTGWASQKFCVPVANKLPCFIISDAKELLMIYRKHVEAQGNGKHISRIAGLWTNCLAFVESMRILFLELSGRKENLRRSDGTVSPEFTLEASDEE